MPAALVNWRAILLPFQIWHAFQPFFQSLSCFHAPQTVANQSHCCCWSINESHPFGSLSDPNFFRIASCRRIVQDAAAGVSRKPQFTRAALLPTAMDAPTVPSISSQLFSHPPTSWENSSFSSWDALFDSSIFKLLTYASPLQSRLMRSLEQLYKIMCEYLAPNKNKPIVFYLFHSMFFRRILRIPRWSVASTPGPPPWSPRGKTASTRWSEWKLFVEGGWPNVAHLHHHPGLRGSSHEKGWNGNHQPHCNMLHVALDKPYLLDHVGYEWYKSGWIGCVAKMRGCAAATAPQLRATVLERLLHP